MKSSRIVFLLAVLVIGVLAAACAPAAQPTTAPAPTVVPQPATAAPKPTDVPKPTVAPTSGAAATTAPTAAAANTAAPTAAVVAAKCDKLASAMPAPAAGQLGAADKPIVMTFVPSGDTGKIAKSGKDIADCLTKMTGLNYNIEVGTSFAASIEAMGANKAQVGFLNTFSILLAQQKYGINIGLVNLRTYKGKLEAFYQGQFIANKAAGIKTIADLKGKTFCFVDPNSTSGYIIPQIALKANGINPDKDLKATQNAGSHPNVAIAVYKGDCDAGATFVDVLTDQATNLAKTYPDILDKVGVFYTTDNIPNDGVQYTKDLDPKIQAITTEGLMAMAKDPGGVAVLKSLYTIEGFIKADNTYYNDFLAVMKKAGVDPATLVK